MPQKPDRRKEGGGEESFPSSPPHGEGELETDQVPDSAVVVAELFGMLM
jgi:hypothetical protein